MNITPKTLNSIDEIYQLCSDYLLVWCFIYSTENDLTSPLLNKLATHDFDDFSTCIISLKLDQNEWIGTDISVPASVPEIQCFCCGGGVCRISSIDDYENSIMKAINLAKQIQPAWLEQHRQ